MANITEKDIIDHLSEKVRFHQNEARRIEALLSAFTDTPSAKVKEDIKKEAVADAKPVKSTKPRKASKLEIPRDYKKDLTINSKIAYALSLSGSGTGESIAIKIVELQPELEVKKVTQQISGVLSTLKSKGLLTAVKEGRKDRYSLA